MVEVSIGDDVVVGVVVRSVVGVGGVVVVGVGDVVGVAVMVGTEGEDVIESELLAVLEDEVRLGSAEGHPELVVELLEALEPQETSPNKVLVLDERRGSFSWSSVTRQTLSWGVSARSHYNETLTWGKDDGTGAQVTSISVTGSDARDAARRSA
jgi:hypothetical protein